MEHSADPEWEWLRRRLVERALVRPPGTYRHDYTSRHHAPGWRPQHVDVSEPLGAAQRLYQARLLAYAPGKDAIPPG